MTTNAKPPLPELMEFSQMINDVENKEPMELALLSMSYLDTALRFAIQSKFASSDDDVIDKVFDSVGAPLGTLSAKVRLASALGVIHKNVAQEISALRNIRNHFAHTIHASDWNNPVVVKYARLLKLTEADLRDFTNNIGVKANEIEQRFIVDDGFGRAIDTDLHHVVSDRAHRIGLYCLVQASDAITNEQQRKYLASFWMVMTHVGASFIAPWSDVTGRQRSS